MTVNVRCELESCRQVELIVASMARPTTALIVDDEAHVRAFLRLVLRELGIATCWEAADGASALTLAAEHAPELLLLDINLPVMGGLQVLAALEQRHPEIPVVIVSAQPAAKTVQESARLGAVGFVVKQSSKEHMLATLREVLDSLEASDDEDENGA